MYNPTDKEIEINFTNIGTTIDPNWISDVYAWRDYLTAANSPVKITLSRKFNMQDKSKEI
ncbi:hypothetical protein H5997_11455 [Megamonas hypermegale]|nr:hypothetical protein [Megamonas hypermegale]